MCNCLRLCCGCLGVSTSDKLILETHWITQILFSGFCCCFVMSNGLLLLLAVFHNRNVSVFLERIVCCLMFPYMYLTTLNLWNVVMAYWFYSSQLINLTLFWTCIRFCSKEIFYNWWVINNQLLTCSSLEVFAMHDYNHKPDEVWALFVWI